MTSSDRQQQEVSPHSPPELTVAVITSWTDRPFSRAVADLALEGLFDIDLYCFHPADLDEVAQDRGERRLDAWLDRSLSEAAQESGCPASCFRIHAVTTSLPDAAAFEEERRGKARDLLAEVVQFAARKRVRAVQVRAGRRIESEGPSTAAGTGYRLRIRPAGALKQLVKSLGEVLTNEKVRDLEVGLALEIEPGPPYLLRDLTDVRELFYSIKDEPWRSRVGLNLDIGHCLIRDWTPNQFAELAAEMGIELFHCHLSDHSRQHFADLSIGAKHRLRPGEPAGGDDPREIADWLDHFRKCCAEGGRFCTRTVSLELEAIEDPLAVHASYRAAHAALRSMPHSSR